ncbi:MAG: amidohydrolase [Chloroflexi bacterium]|nr:amidohydrolase [Chloroflexota bacterium]
MAEQEQVDILIEGGSYVTMDATRRIIRDGAVAIKGDRIAAIGKRDELRQRYRGARTIDASSRVTFPGLVNSHIHFYHNMHRGMAPDNLDGNDWSNFVHANVAPVLTAEDEVWAGYLVLLEIMKSGSTTFLAAGSYNPNPVMEAIPRVGLRGFEGRRTYDYVHLGHQALVDSTEKCLRENEAVMERFAEGFDNGRIKPCVNIVGLGRVTDELIVKSKELADRYGAVLNMHQCAFPEEVQSIKERTGTTPIKHLERLGALGPNVVLVHMVHVTDEEIEILARTKTNVVHNPGTALKIMYGMAPYGKFPEMIKAGVNVALGTDAGDCANFMDIVRAMYLAAVCYKDIRFDPNVMGVETALQMATLNGAKALGLADQIGSLEVGKKADLVLFNSDTPEWQPLYCEPYNLVLSACGDTCDTVIVDGKILMEGRQVKTIDEAEVIAKIKELSKGIEARSGVKPPTTWPIV